MTAKARAPHGSHNRQPRPDWSWQDDAWCQGEPLVLFFGPEGERPPERDIRERKAKAICAGCPVRRECLDYALARPEKAGTWGQMNEDERASERRRRMRRSGNQARLDSLATGDDLAPAEAAS